MLKIFFFLAFLTQKLTPSNVLNGIIFAIDEQCNLIFETALFTNCKSYIIFLFSGAHWGEIEEREIRERRNKKLLKNNKETLFKWNGKKKNRSDVLYIIKLSFERLNVIFFDIFDKNAWNPKSWNF